MNKLASKGPFALAASFLLAACGSSGGSSSNTDSTQIATYHSPAFIAHRQGSVFLGKVAGKAL